MQVNQTGIQLENFQPELTRSDKYAQTLNPPPNRAKSPDRMPGPVVLLGAPGVGKGTQANILAQLWEVPKIATGDILRANVAEGTELGIQADKIMKRGGLVPDEIITEMVANRLSLSDAARGFILDGFPRTVRQAQWLDTYLSLNHRGASLAIIHMTMDLKRIVERVIHRRVCPLCKTTYNTEFMPSKRIGRCDKDGSELEQRSDDSAKVFQARLDVFKRETAPLIRHYQSRPICIEIDAEKPPSLVTRDIVATLRRSRARMARQ